MIIANKQLNGIIRIKRHVLKVQSYRDYYGFWGKWMEYNHKGYVLCVCAVLLVLLLYNSSNNAAASVTMVPLVIPKTYDY